MKVIITTDNGGAVSDIDVIDLPSDLDFEIVEVVNI